MWRSEWMIQPFLYTNIRLRHQRNKTTVSRVVPSYLPRDYNGGLLGDCSKLLRFRNIRVHIEGHRCCGATTLTRLLARLGPLLLPAEGVRA
jgi:hypothetical protein